LVIVAKWNVQTIMRNMDKHSYNLLVTFVISLLESKLGSDQTVVYWGKHQNLLLHLMQFKIREYMSSAFFKKLNFTTKWFCYEYIYECIHVLLVSEARYLMCHLYHYLAVHICDKDYSLFDLLFHCINVFRSIYNSAE